MFETGEIKAETPNVGGARLFWFSNNIINLEHVIEIDTKSNSGGYSIIFKFIDGTERLYSYKLQAEFSLSWKTILHCLKKNLFSLELTSECYSKWAEYRVRESSRT